MQTFPLPTVKDKSGHYQFTDEQKDWIMKYAGKKYPFNCIQSTIGISWNAMLRVRAEEGGEWEKKLKKMKSDQRKSQIAIRKKRKEETEAFMERARQRKLEAEEERRKAKEPKKPKVWLWDIEQKEKKYEEEQRKNAELKAAAKAERAEDRLNHKCYLKRKDIERKPTPFSIDEQVVRQKAYDRYYILPDGEELFTDRRRCIYWDEDTKRSEELEREADELKFNVIEYRRMFPDKSNSLSSCVIDYDEVMD